MGNYHGPGDIEAELIAAQEVFVAAVLADFMGYGIQVVVAEVFEKAAVPVLDGAAAALGGAVRTQSQVAGLGFGLFDGGVHLRGKGGRGRLLVGARCGGAQIRGKRAPVKGHQGSVYQGGAIETHLADFTNPATGSLPLSTKRYSPDFHSAIPAASFTVRSASLPATTRTM